jgi:hypothetical protein
MSTSPNAPSVVEVTKTVGLAASSAVMIPVGSLEPVPRLNLSTNSSLYPALSAARPAHVLNEHALRLA